MNFHNDGQLRQQLFDTEGRLRESSLRAGARAQVRGFDYDDANRLTAVSDFEGGTRRIAWNAADQIEARIDALGRAQRYRYNPGGELVEVIDAANAWQAQATRIGRDALGLVASVTAPNGAESRYVVDDFGRALVVDSPDSGRSVHRYDEADRLVAATDALGNNASYRYDAAGHIVEQTVTGPGKARTLVTKWTYRGDLLMAVEHPVQSEHYEYDGSRRLVSRTVTLHRQGASAIASTTRYHYDADGQPDSLTLADGSILQLQLRRDARNQIVALERQRIVTPWLRWLLPAERLAGNIRRDLTGISAFDYGNGVQARFERSASGALARVSYRRPGLGDTSRRAGAALAMLAGIAPAHAASPANPTHAAGSLALQFDKLAVLDYRYLWDVQGNLLRLAEDGGVRDYAYDAHDRLIIEARQDVRDGLQEVALEGANQKRYFYDRGGNRVLGQEGATLRTAYAPGSNRWLGQADAADAVRYDAGGQPHAIGKHDYEWDALGRLVTVREAGQVLATYRYNHRGERVAKTVRGADRFYLYSGRRIMAELDGAGRVARQYVYLADKPVAIIDIDGGAESDTRPASAIAQAFHDLNTAIRAWFVNSCQTLVYLHTNHLGAPEAATDTAGKPVWKARYAAFGGLAADEGFATAFNQPLRLPGQYQDDETGLYYNDHRYYDPRTGRYLSPDPLGLHAAANGYAYVDSNPLKYVDPEGLVLFAFDGTGNTEDGKWLEENGGTRSNVSYFRERYQDRFRYISGVGTIDTSDPDRPIRPTDYVPATIPVLRTEADMGGNYSGRARIERMQEYFNTEAEFAADDEMMMVDIIGFSRGAAQARDFANRIVANTRDGWYRYSVTQNGVTTIRCQRVSFRFMGLWDTVLSTDKPGKNGSPAYQLAIPDQFAYVAQAVALNEFREKSPSRGLPGSWGAFPLESIVGKTVPNNVTRIERGFIGSHSDIGGGYAPGQTDLAKVALNWMLNEAVKAGVPVNAAPEPISSSPFLHDKSDNQFNPTGAPSPYNEDRDVHYMNGTTVKQRTMKDTGLTYADTTQFISYLDLPTTTDADGNVKRQPRKDFVTGNINMPAYLQWLKDHGYNITLNAR